MWWGDMKVVYINTQDVQKMDKDFPLSPKVLELRVTQ